MTKEDRNERLGIGERLNSLIKQLRALLDQGRGSEVLDILAEVVPDEEPVGEENADDAELDLFPGDEIFWNPELRSVESQKMIPRSEDDQEAQQHQEQQGSILKSKEEIAEKISPADCVEKATMYCRLVDNAHLPKELMKLVIDRLVLWKLIDLNDISDNIFENYHQFSGFIKNVQRVRIAQHNSEFINAFNNDPWNGEPIEAEYTDDELGKWPYLHLEAIKKSLGDSSKFIFRVQKNFFTMVLTEQDDGSRQIVRLASSQRSQDQVQNDVLNMPDIIPKTEIIAVGNNEYVMLIEWINGKTPQTEAEKLRCYQAAEALLVVPIGEENLYDLNSGNFLIVNNDGVEKIYYVDRDIPASIVKNGLDPDGVESRRNQFERSKNEKVR